MEIPTKQEILLFRLVICSIILIFRAMCTIELLIYSFCCVSKICGGYLINLSVFVQKNIVFRRLYSWLSFSLQHN